MRLFVNNHHVGRHLSQLPVHESMWAVIDVYGNTVGVTSIREESVPVQILARGHEAVQAFLTAQSQDGLSSSNALLLLIIIIQFTFSK